MGLALENIGQRDGRSAHIAVFGSSLVELPQVYRTAADRHDLIEVDIGLLPAPRRVEDVADAQRTSELLTRPRYGFVMAPEALGLLPDTLHSLVVFFRGVGLVDIPGGGASSPVSMPRYSGRYGPETGQARYYRLIRERNPSLERAARRSC